MRITYIHQYYSNRNMAGGTRSFEMAKRLVEMGHQVHMITSDRCARRVKRHWSLTEDSGIAVHWFPVPYANEMSYRKRVKAFLDFAYQAAIESRSIDSDVIFATSTPLTIAIPAIYASLRLKVPMVFEVRDLWPEGPIALGIVKNPLLIKLSQWLEQIAYHSSCRVVALSPGMKQAIIETGFPAELVTVIPNACDFELFESGNAEACEIRNSHKWLQDRPLVIYAGTIGFVNHLSYMVNVAKQTLSLNPEIRFLVLGSGKEEVYIRRLALELGILDKNFFMLPSVPKKKVPAWLAAADIATSFVINNEVTWKNSANKFFDALAAGKPIAINYGGWQAELIETYDAGLLLDPQDIPLAANHLAARINDKAWLTETGLRCKRLGKEMFDRDKLARELERVLLETAEASHAKGS